MQFSVVGKRGKYEVLAFLKNKGETKVQQITTKRDTDGWQKSFLWKIVKQFQGGSSSAAGFVCVCHSSLMNSPGDAEILSLSV